MEQLAVRVPVALVGIGVVVATLLSAIRTVVVPRAESVLLTRVLFAVVRVPFAAAARLHDGEEWTDRVLGLYAPVALLLLPLAWLTSVYAGFTAVFWAAGEGDVAASLDIAGSSLLTLGFSRPETPLGLATSYVGAALTIAIVVLLLVTYLPTMYASFAERERRVMLLEARAGAPPSGVELLVRLGRIHGLADVDELWVQWEEWFATVAESHTSQPALVHFRSQRADQHWVTAAGALLDAAGLYVTCVDHAAVRDGRHGTTATSRDGLVERVRMPQAELCIRAGYLCLRDVARVLGLPVDDDPAPDDPISVTREEFDAGWDRMAEVGVPLVADRDEAWTAWAGWRVTYDLPLRGLVTLTAAPSSPWVGDRPRVARHGHG